jgi:HD-like signal output (HDOD) protein
MASQLVAQALREQEPETVFLGGLMQNIGQLVLARAETETFHEIVEQSAAHQVPYHMVEREILGFDHGELGALLIREWNLSRELEEAVRFHHRLDEVEPGNRLPAMIALGEEIADCSGSRPEEDEVYWENSEPARYLDVSAEIYAELREQARLLSIDPQFFA